MQSLMLSSDLRIVFRVNMMGQLRAHVNTLQNECLEHVDQEEDKMRKELQHALQHVSRPTATNLTTGSVRRSMQMQSLIERRTSSNA